MGLVIVWFTIIVATEVLTFTTNMGYEKVRNPFLKLILDH